MHFVLQTVADEALGSTTRGLSTRRFKAYMLTACNKHRAGLFCDTLYHIHQSGHPSVPGQWLKDGQNQRLAEWFGSLTGSLLRALLRRGALTAT